MFRIQVDNLKFKLPNAADPLFVISHLVVKPGEKLAIIGPNETGKTSFLKALISKTESSQIKIHRTIAYVIERKNYGQKELFRNQLPELLKRKFRLSFSD
ncbi:ATP-binding cassette domain-containing protein [Oenococcus oeni]|uniref:ATP-binding cassette domain-containing protein n=1 Tax=Oenococcus oeni TaxID=1247 RepID=UPI0009B4FD25|nr:ATP-binding cassette domain-containing protein [Oenococcus oeni]